MSRARTTELEAVNRILRSLKKSPVTTLDSSFGEDGHVREILDAAARDLLCQRWSFNTDRLTIKADNNGDMRLPDSVLVAKILRRDRWRGLDRYTLRGTRVWDRQANTYRFEPGTELTVDVTHWLDWNDRPEYANLLITAIAARDANRETLGDAQADAVLERRVQTVQAIFEATEAAVNPANAFDVHSDDLSDGDPRRAVTGYIW